MFKRTACLIALCFAQLSLAQNTSQNNSKNQSGDQSSPPSGVEIEIGMGSRIGGPQVSNYQTNNGVLSITNLGRATPQLLTGLGFEFCDPTVQQQNSAFCKNSFSSRLGVFVTAQFGSGSNQTISGYSLGMTVGLGKYLRGLAGFSLTPVSQISPGFAIAASQYVAKNPSLFPGINPANLASNSYGAFDGIQYTSTAPMAGASPSAVIYYPGSVTETHYRGGFLIGVAMPINIFKLFSGNGSGGSQ